MRFISAALLLLALTTGCLAEDQPQPYAHKLSIVTQAGETHDFTVDIADTPETRAIGLMFRDKMPPGSGMLFLFNMAEDRAFWMKNTLIPLDMIFIGAGGKITHIHHRAVPHDLSPVPSNGPAIAVLEINGGRAKALGLMPGDVVHHPRLDNAAEAGQ